MRERRSVLVLSGAMLAAMGPSVALAHNGVAGPAIAYILTIYSIPPLVGWLLALLTLRGEATVLGAVVGAVGCFLAAGGMMMLLVLLRQATPPALAAVCVLPALCLMGHVMRTIRVRRSQRPTRRAHRGFFRDLWRHL